MRSETMPANTREDQRRSTHRKQSTLAIGVLMLSLAALQSPLWRAQSAGATIAVRTGGAVLIASEHPIARIALEQTPQATAEVVGDHEVLIRGKALGQTELRILTEDGRTSTYRVVVQAESARSPRVPPVSR